MAVDLREYRVLWQREGLKRRSKLFQRRDAAERYVLRLEGRMEELTRLDPYAFACCSGHECGCGGRLNVDVWEEMRVRLPALVMGPVLEERVVGAWEPS